MFKSSDFARFLSSCLNLLFLPSLFLPSLSSFNLTSLLILIGLGVSGLSVQTQAAFEDGFIGARAFAMGGAFTAIGNESDGLLANSASIANLKHLPESRQSTQQLSATTAKLHGGLSDEHQSHKT